MASFGDLIDGSRINRLAQVTLAGVLAVFVAGGTAQAGGAGTRDGADDPQVMPPIGGGRIAEALRTTQPPTLDGSVLDDPAWADAPVLTGFWQTTPFEGAPASERTEVRLMYTADTLYVGVVAYDSSPAQIVSAEGRRDSPLDDTDSFLIILDTYHDRQNGFVFGTTPAGIEYDGQVTNEGAGGGGGPGRQQAGSGGGFNINWDGDWQVRTRVTDIGWTAEFAIPFRTLRYPTREVQTWGVNFQRNIRRRNETSFWAPLTRQYNLHRLSLAGQLTGLQVPPQRNLQLMPYVLGESKQRGTRASGTTSVGDFGVDLKYGITPSLTLDATYNTDFAQVEVDDQQINLDRFSLFFPEKRPFFLENAGLFSVGMAREAEVFFTRRIGIGPGGTLIPIVGGARLTGRIGGDVDVGLLNIQTEAVPGLAPGNNFSVARVRRELPNRSAVGAIFVNRQGTGEFAGANDYNRSYAADARLGIGQNALVHGFLAKTQTPGLSGEDYAFQLGSSYSSQAWTLSANYGEVGDNFNPEVGFLQRGGFRKFDASVFRRIRPENFGDFHELRPHVVFRGYWNHEGFQETGWLHVDQHWELRGGHEFHTGMNLTREGVTRPFTIFPGVVVPPGTYDHAEAMLVGFTNRGAPFSAFLRVIAGGFFGGNRVQYEPELRFRVGDTFSSQLSVSYNDIDLPWGKFQTNLWRSRLSYSFTPRIYLQSLLQYNDRANIWSSNVRFGWLHQANTGLFVVYNDTQGLAGSDLLRADRSLTIKISRLLNMFN